MSSLSPIQLLNAQVDPGPGGVGPVLALCGAGGQTRCARAGHPEAAESPASSASVARNQIGAGGFIPRISGSGRMTDDG